MFANLVGKSSVAVIDREKQIVMATWFIGQEGKENTAMAFDETNHRLFVFARDPGKLIVLDSDSGNLIASLPCVDMVDGAVFDACLSAFTFPELNSSTCFRSAISIILISLVTFRVPFTPKLRF